MLSPCGSCHAAHQLHTFYFLDASLPHAATRNSVGDVLRVTRNAPLAASTTSAVAGSPPRASVLADAAAAVALTPPQISKRPSVADYDYFSWTIIVEMTHLTGILAWIDDSITQRIPRVGWPRSRRWSCRQDIHCPWHVPRRTFWQHPCLATDRSNSPPPCPSRCWHVKTGRCRLLSYR